MEKITQCGALQYAHFNNITGVMRWRKMRMSESIAFVIKGEMHIHFN